MENKPTRFSLSVFTYIFNQDLSKTLLIKRNEEKRERWGFDWGIPGGCVELGEFTRSAAAREIKEETGIDVKPEQLIFTHTQERPNAGEVSGVQFFYAVIIDEKTAISLNGESESFEWFPLDKLPESKRDSDEKFVEVLNIIRNAK